MSDRKPEHPDLAHFERLDGLVRELVERLQAMRKENAALRDQLTERGARVRELEDQHAEWTDLRGAATGRIDQLVEQLDQLEAELDRRFDPVAED